MHGGLFKRDDVKLDELRTIDRNRQPGEEGISTLTIHSILLVLSLGCLLKLFGNVNPTVYKHGLNTSNLLSKVSMLKILALCGTRIVESL